MRSPPRQNKEVLSDVPPTSVAETPSTSTKLHLLAEAALSPKKSAVRLVEQLTEKMMGIDRLKDSDTLQPNDDERINVARTSVQSRRNLAQEVLANLAA